MNWFSKKPKRRSSATKHRYDDSHPSWNPQRTLAGLIFLGIVIALIGSIVGWRYSKQNLTNYVAAHRGTVVDTQHVILVDKPVWMNQMVRDDLCRLIGREVSYDPLDQQGLQRAVAALLSNPWVDQVHQLRRMNQGEIHVTAQYRQPVALVEWNGGYHLISAQGIQLPGIYLNHQLKELELPLMIGAASPPQGSGLIWPGDDLEAGLSLLSWLRDEPYLDQIQSVDVSGRDDRGRIHLTLRTEHGAVRWGLPPSLQQVVEPNATIKKQWLRDVYLRRGAIDAGGKIVDVYGAAVFVHQPVAYDDRETH